MARIKRVKATDSTDGIWQQQQIKEGWYTADFDFETNEFIMKRCEDIETITPQQARLRSYANFDDLTEQQKKILFGNEGQ